MMTSFLHGNGASVMTACLITDYIWFLTTQSDPTGAGCLGQAGDPAKQP